MNSTAYAYLLGSVAAVLYLIAGLMLGVRLARAGNGIHRSRVPPLLLAVAAVLLHALLLGHTVLLPQGLDLSFFNALSLAGWLIAAVLIATAVFRPVENLGIVLLPFSAVAAVLGLTLGTPRVVTEPDRWPLELHVVISMLAYALLAMATVQALLLALQDYRLRHRHPGGFIAGIPPLTAMEGLLFQLLGAGFALLSLALVTGFVFLEDIFAQHLVHKTVLSLVAWVVFALLLWGRWRYGWRGRIALRWTLGGFVSLVLAYFGSKLVLELILQR